MTFGDLWIFLTAPLSTDLLTLVGLVSAAVLGGLAFGLWLMERRVTREKWRAYQDAIAAETRARVIHREKPDAFVLAKEPSYVMYGWVPDALKPGARGMRVWGDGDE